MNGANNEKYIKYNYPYVNIFFNANAEFYRKDSCRAKEIA